MINKISDFYHIFIIACLVTGCKALSHPLTSEINYQGVSLTQIEEAIRRGELYRARQMAREILGVDPGNEHAQRMMSEIIEQEIEREREATGTRAREEMSAREKLGQEKIWIDRAKTFLSLNQYDQAIFSAEKAFLYNPDSYEASRLVDEIRIRAFQNSGHEKEILKQETQVEIQNRVIRYREEARQWIAEKRWGAARLAITKVLLLLPEDREAHELYEQIQERNPNP